VNATHDADIDILTSVRRCLSHGLIGSTLLNISTKFFYRRIAQSSFLTTKVIEDQVIDRPRSFNFLLIDLLPRHHIRQMVGYWCWERQDAKLPNTGNILYSTFIHWEN